MTDEEYEQLAAKYGLTSPKALYAGAAEPGPVVTQIATDPSASLAIAGGPQAGAVPVGTGSPRAQGLTTPDLTNVATPTRISFEPSGELTVATPTQSTFISGKGTPADVNKLIDYQIKDRSNRYQEQQANVADAIKTLQDLDATDEQKQGARDIVQGRKIAAPFGYNSDGTPITSSDLDRLLPSDLEKSDRQSYLKHLQRAAYVQTITPDITPQEAALKQYANLQVGPSWRALQDLGLQYPGVTGKYATAPVFQSAAPGPPAARAQAVPGQAVDPVTGRAIAAPPSNIGLTTVRGTEFGEIDNPARGGYTEAGWNTGAWGANIADKENPMVALPYSILNKYGNPRDKDFGSNFNAKYEVHVVDPKTGKVVVASLGDAGPGAKTGAGLDMTWGTREKLGLPVGFSGNVSYRVVPKGSALPDNTTPSVAQTQQAAQNQATASGNFASGANANEVYIQPVDRRTVRDPSVYGKTMTNDELLKHARVMADDYASAMDSAGTPIDMKQYQENFQKFYDSALKYKDAKEEVKPPPGDYNDRFDSLAALVSPTAAVDPAGKPTSQIDLLQVLQNRVRGKPPGTDEAREFDAQKGHLVANVARGLFGQKGNLSESEQKAADEGIPTYWDSEASSQFKTNLLRSSIRDKMRQIIQFSKAQHFDTTAMEQEYRRIYGLDKAATDEAHKKKADQYSGQLSKTNQPPQVTPTNQPPQTTQFNTSTNQIVGGNQQVENPWYGY